jgi:VWFA-related protein
MWISRYFVLAVVCSLTLAGNAQQPGTAVPQTQVPAVGQTQTTTPMQRPGAAPIPGNGQIQLDVEVTDKQGKPISGLEASDFKLFDNDRPTTIASFHAYTSANPPPIPVQVILLIDTANMDFQDVANARIAIDKFLRQNGGHLALPVSIVWLTDEGLEVQPGPTTDGNAAAAALDETEGRLRTVGRDAGQEGALQRFQLSLQNLGRIVNALSQHPGRKLLIWDGPGWPILNNSSVQTSWNQEQQLFKSIIGFSTQLRQGQITLYSVHQGMLDANTYLYEGYLKGVKELEQAGMPNLDLKVLAVESGGLAILPSNDLTPEIVRCVEDASAFYTISFVPPHADGPNEYHQLKVEVDKPELTVRTNTGYYDQPSTLGDR